MSMMPTNGAAGEPPSLSNNLLLLDLGAFLPLGFTDSSAIYHYWRIP